LGVDLLLAGTRDQPRRSDRETLPSREQGSGAPLPRFSSAMAQVYRASLAECSEPTGRTHGRSHWVPERSPDRREQYRNVASGGPTASVCDGRIERGAPIRPISHEVKHFLRIGADKSSIKSHCRCYLASQILVVGLRAGGPPNSMRSGAPERLEKGDGDREAGDGVAGRANHRLRHGQTHHALRHIGSLVLAGLAPLPERFVLMVSASVSRCSVVVSQGISLTEIATGKAL